MPKVGGVDSVAVLARSAALAAGGVGVAGLGLFGDLKQTEALQLMEASAPAARGRATAPRQSVVDCFSRAISIARARCARPLRSTAICSCARQTVDVEDDAEVLRDLRGDLKDNIQVVQVVGAGNAGSSRTLSEIAYRDELHRVGAAILGALGPPRCSTARLVEPTRSSRRSAAEFQALVWARSLGADRACPRDEQQPPVKAALRSRCGRIDALHQWRCEWRSLKLGRDSRKCSPGAAHPARGDLRPIRVTLFDRCHRYGLLMAFPCDERRGTS